MVYSLKMSSPAAEVFKGLNLTPVSWLCLLLTSHAVSSYSCFDVLFAYKTLVLTCSKGTDPEYSFAQPAIRS